MSRWRAEPHVGAGAVVEVDRGAALVDEGDASELRRDPRFLAAYLG